MTAAERDTEDHQTVYVNGSEYLDNSAIPIVSEDILNVLFKEQRKRKLAKQQKHIDDFRATQKEPRANGPLVGKFYIELVDKLFDKFEVGFVDLIEQQQPDAVDYVKMERMFAHHIQVTVENIGAFEIYSVPQD